MDRDVSIEGARFEGTKSEGAERAKKNAHALRHVVITGASSGIGEALARHYAGKCSMLSLLGRDPKRTEAVADACASAGSAVSGQTGDVTDGAFMTAWLGDCDTRLPVDLVIANAGLGGSFSLTQAPWEELPVAAALFQTNVIGVANTVLPLLPRMVERKQGHLVLMSSLAGFLGLGISPAYCASKAAVRVYAQGLRQLVSRHGVRVTAVCPGFVETAMSDSLPGQRPFLWSAEKAARRIAHGVESGRHEIVFPWPLAALTRLAAVLPSSVRDFAVNRTMRRQKV